MRTLLSNILTIIEETEYNGTLEIVEKDDYYALQLSDEDWEIVSDIRCEVMIDDGEGLIDLGSDNYYEFDDDGDLMVTFDRSWICIEGQLVPYYVTEATTKYTKARVPAYLNGEEVYIIVGWQNDSAEGEVLGAQYVDGYGNTTISQRGLVQIKSGDKIDIICEFYKYDGTYEDQYYYGDTIEVGKDDLKVDYRMIPSGKTYVYYHIIDIYGNDYYTEAVEYNMDE